MKVYIVSSVWKHADDFFISNEIVDAAISRDDAVKTLEREFVNIRRSYWDKVDADITIRFVENEERIYIYDNEGHFDLITLEERDLRQ